MAAGVAVLVLVLLRAFVVQTFTVVADSMRPTLHHGDRVAVLKTATIGRGDLVVLEGDHLLGTPATAYVKRVIGVPGDRVACCADGRLVVNGAPANEPYVLGPTDQTTFDVTVPDERYWVLGDNRADSADSRSALGRPGGGMLRAGDVIGEVVWRYWPSDRIGRISSTTSHGAHAGTRAVSGVGDTAREHPSRQRHTLGPAPHHEEPRP